MGEAVTTFHAPQALLQSSPGLTRPSRGSGESFEEIVPFRVPRDDKVHFPGERPMLDVLLALDSGANVLVVFCPNQPFEPISYCETFNFSFPMFLNAAREIAGNPDVQGPVWPVRDHVDPATPHTPIPSIRNPIERRRLDGRVKPDHDVPCLLHGRP